MDERQERVHPGRQYGVFIMSHGRPDKQFTYTTLRREGYTGPIRIVCDDEDSTVDQYKANFPGEVLVFNKVETIKKTETFYNQPYHKTVMYARHTLYDFSKQLGWTHFIMMDDDYYHIYFKWNHYYKEVGLTRFKGMEAQRLDELFDATFDFLAVSKANTISFAQGGDTLGGSSGKAGTHYLSRKAMNSHFVDVSRPLDFRGFVNEDVNLYAEFPGNRFIFQTNRVSVDPAHTQQSAGGATDLYLAFGTYVKSFMTVMCAPSCTKVKWMQNGKQQGRLHHMVKVKNACPAIVSGRWAKVDGDNSNGMWENPEYAKRDAEYAELDLAVHPMPPESWKTDPIDKDCKVNSMRKPKAPKAKGGGKPKGSAKPVEVEIPDPIAEEARTAAKTPEAKKAEAPEPAKNMVAIATTKPIEEVATAQKPKLELVVLESDMDNIDPRSLGKLLIALMDKVDLSVVHGDPSTDDIVCKLCAGLGVARVDLCGPNNAPIYDKHVGKKVLKRCQPNEKPEFSILER